MWTTAQIRRHIAKLRSGELFTTRSVLSYGTRGAVDQALYTLVELGEIERLARGVFVVPCPVKLVIAACQVAQVKAAAFGKRIVTHPVDAAKKFGLLKTGNAEPTFSVNGPSSSFRFGDITIHFKRASARKVILGDDKAGLAIKAMWHMGKDALTKALVQSATREFRHSDRNKFKHISALMPAWLSDFLYRWRNETKGRAKTGEQHRVAAISFWSNLLEHQDTTLLNGATLIY